MSGGSYNYLCHKDAEEFFGYGSGMGDLEAMRDRLAAMPDGQDAARETERLIAVIRQTTVRVDVAIERLRPVWRAVEWRDSGDYRDEDITAALSEYRGDGS